MSAKKYVQNTVFALAILIAQGLAGQQPDVLFETLPPRSDFGQRTVNAMLQDRQGYLWFATWSGLWRYDAYKFRQFGHEAG